jgi:hypothetical protein
MGASLKGVESDLSTSNAAMRPLMVRALAATRDTGSRSLGRLVPPELCRGPPPVKKCARSGMERCKLDATFDRPNGALPPHC